MNKFVTSSIAAAAGVALLLGGAGTFATWNASAATTGSSISAGNLVVADSGVAGTWTANGSATPVDLATYSVVPGDVLTYTKTMTIGAEGDSLKATLALTPASITAANSASATDQALAGYLNANAKLTATGTGISGTGPTFTVTPGAGTVNQTVTITVTLTFPKGDTVGGNNNAMNGAVKLSDLAVSLTQITA